MSKRILITGATGLVGLELSRTCLAQGWELVVLGRRSSEEFRRQFPLPCEYFCWSRPDQTLPPLESLREIWAVVHLAGESIGEQRWTSEVKKRLFDSRVLSTRNLVQAMQRLAQKPEVFISASAVGIFGDAGDLVFTEESSLPESQEFLSLLCRSWEAEARRAPCRAVQMRLGVVLSRNGGALSKMIPFAKFGLSGRLGSGQQWMSWIHLADLVRMIQYVVENPTVSGSVHAVAPQPVRQREFAQELAKNLQSWMGPPVPRVFLRLMLGEQSCIVLDSQRVLPQKLQALGFEFSFPDLRSALGEVCS